MLFFLENSPSCGFDSFRCLEKLFSVPLFSILCFLRLFVSYWAIHLTHHFEQFFLFIMMSSVFRLILVRCFFAGTLKMTEAFASEALTLYNFWSLLRASFSWELRWFTRLLSMSRQRFSLRNGTCYASAFACHSLFILSIHAVLCYCSVTNRWSVYRQSQTKPESFSNWFRLPAFERRFAFSHLLPGSTLCKWNQSECRGRKHHDDVINVSRWSYAIRRKAIESKTLKWIINYRIVVHADCIGRLEHHLPPVCEKHIENASTINVCVFQVDKVAMTRWFHTETRRDYYNIWMFALTSERCQREIWRRT